MCDPGDTWDENSNVARTHSLQKKWRLLHPMRLTPAVTCLWHSGHTLPSCACPPEEKNAATSRGPPSPRFRASRSAREGGAGASEAAESVAVGGGSAHSFALRAARFPPGGRASALHSAGGPGRSESAPELLGSLAGGG